MNIHPTALVDPHARLAADVSIGPFCIVEAETEIGTGCRLEARVSIKRGTTLGPRNWVCEGTVLGGMPQHSRIPDQPGRVVIGSDNVLRENVTVHRALKTEATTVVGDHNLLMAGAHVAHDCVVGSRGIFANNALLGGHVTVGDRAYVSGGVAVHQFCRIGDFAMVGGQARVVQDIPPYVTIDGQSGCVVGLNLIGLRRAGFTSEQLNQLKAAYRIIFRRSLKWSDMLVALKEEFTSGPVVLLSEFLSGGSRGFVQERRLPPHATLKFRQPEEESGEAAERRSKAG